MFLPCPAAFPARGCGPCSARAIYITPPPGNSNPMKSTMFSGKYSSDSTKKNGPKNALPYKRAWPFFCAAPLPSLATCARNPTRAGANHSFFPPPRRPARAHRPAKAAFFGPPPAPRPKAPCAPPCRPTRRARPRRPVSRRAARAVPPAKHTLPLCSVKACAPKGGSNLCGPVAGDRGPLSREFSQNSGVGVSDPKTKNQPSKPGGCCSIRRFTVNITSRTVIRPL